MNLNRQGPVAATTMNAFNGFNGGTNVPYDTSNMTAGSPGWFFPTTSNPYSNGAMLNLPSSMDRIKQQQQHMQQWARQPVEPTPGAALLCNGAPLISSHSSNLSDGGTEPKFPPQFLDIPDIVAGGTSLSGSIAGSAGYGSAVAFGQFQQQQRPPLHHLMSAQQQQLVYARLQQQAADRTLTLMTSSPSPTYFPRQNGVGLPPMSDAMSEQLTRVQSMTHGMSPSLNGGVQPPSLDAILAQKRLETKSTEVRRSRASRRKKRDPNEPQKPVSAYAMFFRDTQAVIKGQNPAATFGDISKIVAAMWDNLDDKTKAFYKKRTDTAKKDYLKRLAAYRATQVSQEMTESSPEAAAPECKSMSPDVASPSSLTSPPAANGCSQSPHHLSPGGAPVSGVTTGPPAGADAGHVLSQSPASHYLHLHQQMNGDRHTTDHATVPQPYLQLHGDPSSYRNNGGNFMTYHQQQQQQHHPSYLPPHQLGHYHYRQLQQQQQQEGMSPAFFLNQTNSHHALSAPH